MGESVLCQWLLFVSLPNLEIVTCQHIKSVSFLLRRPVLQKFAS